MSREICAELGPLPVSITPSRLAKAMLSFNIDQFPSHIFRLSSKAMLSPRMARLRVELFLLFRVQPGHVFFNGGSSIHSRNIRGIRALFIESNRTGKILE